MADAKTGVGRCHEHELAAFQVKTDFLAIGADGWTPGLTTQGEQVAQVRYPDVARLAHK